MDPSKELAERLRVVLSAQSQDPDALEFLDDLYGGGEYLDAVAAGLESAVLFGVVVPVGLLEELDKVCGAAAATRPAAGIDDIPLNIHLLRARLASAA
ncbi:hypothetical protein ACSYDW_07120 [Paeniglutamicibacter sp. R2-26]|uniref:hypothetical protein n=1 Tax=Paeniglutamicibacter sp. R2-26 TaxID=3144417 RepID=UPI003EE74B32